MTTRMDDIKRWDVLTICEKLMEQRDDLRRIADSAAQETAEDLYSVIDSLNELVLDLDIASTTDDQNAPSPQE